MTGIGERSFIRVFEKATGYTPHAYVMDARINAARSMLSNFLQACQADSSELRILQAVRLLRRSEIPSRHVSYGVPSPYVVDDGLNR